MLELAQVLERLAALPPPLPLRRTERLLLRPFQERDREPFAAMHADGKVMAHVQSPLTEAEATDLFDRLRVSAARQGFGVWAVEDKVSKSFLGLVGLAPVSFEAPFTPAVEVLWRFAHTAWGQGFATEAAREALVVAFGPLGLPRIVSFTTPANTRSWRLMERLGLRREGAFAHPKLPADHPLSAHLLYVIDAPTATVLPPVPAAAATTAAPAPEATPSLPIAPASPPRPQVWLDGDGCPRPVKDIVWRAVQRGVIACTIVANRPLVIPRHAHIHSVVVKHGLDVADEWLVANAKPGELVVTGDVPLAAELVARGVHVVSPRGERFTPSNMGEKLSVRDFFTEARAAGMLEGGGPAAFDERAKQGFANALDRWIAHGS